jgi:hypothetical protein
MLNMKNFCFLAITAMSIVLFSCKKDDPEPTPIPAATTPYVIFKFYFDSTQVRLDNLGNPSTVPAGNSAQSPVFNKMAAHYVELTPTALTAVGSGKILYHAAETSVGGSIAIDHSQSVMKGQNEEFLRVPVSSITPGTYNYLRVSLAYQNYDIRYKTVVASVPYYLTGTIASFIGYNTYINNYTIKNTTQTPSASAGGPGNHLQGYWGFETTYLTATYFADGQAAGTTVPNPISATSPIPAGSCLVTGQFPTALTITGNETSDIVIRVSLSTNKSFEWKDANMDGAYEPSAGDTVVDMGIRGLIPIVQ